MLVLVFFDEDAEDFHHGGKRVVFILAYFINEAIQQFHELAVFAVVVWHAQGRLDLRPHRKSFFNLSCGHIYFSFHLPVSRTA